MIMTILNENKISISLSFHMYLSCYLNCRCKRELILLYLNVYD
jgi:hypothetical protein